MEEAVVGVESRRNAFVESGGLANDRVMSCVGCAGVTSPSCERLVEGIQSCRMMDFWSTTWGDIATLVGIAVSLGGLSWAIIEASGARTASEAAEEAAKDASNQIAHRLQTVDLQRAIGLIERIKTLHANDRWEASVELYQSLRAMLSDVIARSPEDKVDVREKLATARAIVRTMEDSVRDRDNGAISKRERSRFNGTLNEIQSNLEDLASSVGFADPQGETR